MSNTILIVEDDGDSRELLAAWLQHHRYRPLVARNGRDALRILEAERPCVILLDLRMPEMNGWEFRQVQLSDTELRTIPVVVISAERHKADLMASLQAAAFFQKPLDLSRLVDTVHQVCRHSQAGTGRERVGE